MAVPRTIAGISSRAIDQALAEFDALGRDELEILASRWAGFGVQRVAIEGREKTIVLVRDWIG